MLRDDATLVDILHAARLTAQFTAGMDRSAFLADAKTQSAVLHQLLILGEAVKRLSPEFRAEHAQLPWKMMAGMRDIIIHQYDSVDLEEVWETLNRDLRDIIVALEPLVPPKAN